MGEWANGRAIVSLGGGALLRPTHLRLVITFVRERPGNRAIRDGTEGDPAVDGLHGNRP